MELVNLSGTSWIRTSVGCTIMYDSPADYEVIAPVMTSASGNCLRGWSLPIGHQGMMILGALILSEHFDTRHGAHASALLQTVVRTLVGNL